jgi:hypothetical protein
MHLIENGISEQTANRIQMLVDKDGAFDDIIKELKTYTKDKTEVNIASNKSKILFFVDQGSKLMKNIVDELETIVKYARGFGVTIPV